MITGETKASRSLLAKTWDFHVRPIRLDARTAVVEYALPCGDGFLEREDLPACVRADARGGSEVSPMRLVHFQQSREHWICGGVKLGPHAGESGIPRRPGSPPDLLEEKRIRGGAGALCPGVSANRVVMLEPVRRRRMCPDVPSTWPLRAGESSRIFRNLPKCAPIMVCAPPARNEPIRPRGEGALSRSLTSK
jgi:hypothetical protein